MVSIFLKFVLIVLVTFTKCTSSVDISIEEDAKMARGYQSSISTNNNGPSNEVTSEPTRASANGPEGSFVRGTPILDTSKARERSPRTVGVSDVSSEVPSTGVPTPLTTSRRPKTPGLSNIPDRLGSLLTQVSPNGSDFYSHIMKMILQRPDVLLKFFNQLTNASDPSSLQKMLLPGGLGNSGGSGGNVFNTVLSVVQSVLPEMQMFGAGSLPSGDQCTADFSAYIQGVRNMDLWALKMLDASGKPGDSILEGALKFLGNYDECLEISQTVTNNVTGTSHVIKGNYCHVTLTPPEALLNATMDIPFPLGVPQLQWDLCLPLSCNNTQVFDAVSKLPLNKTGMSLVSVKFVEQKDWKQDSVAIATVVVLSVIVLLSVIGTVYDVITTEIRSARERRHSQSEGRINDVFFFNHPHHLDKRLSSNGTHGSAFEHVEIYQGRESVPHDGFGRQLLLSFSLSRNTEKILNTKAGDSNLGCIHGIRVLSMAWVILGHSMTWESMKTWINAVEYAGWTRRFTMQFLVNGTLSVDTFFVLTGCLVTYLFLKESEKTSKGKPTVSQMVLYYVHRWWRLTPVYMVLVLCSTGLMRYLITGPFADLKDQLLPDNCRTQWWTNILYINNFYDFSNMCYPVTWFLANDMQFYVIAPLALLPLAFGVSWLGYIVISLFLATHLSMYGYLEWKYDGATQFTNNGPAMNDIYIVPWCRIGAFAIGMFLGVILHRTRCKLRMRRFALVLGWQLFLGIGLLCTYMTYDQFRAGSAGWDVNARIIHETLNRPGWSLFVAWLILVCCTGYGGFINSLLSWSPWIPLGRLTYGAYLIHPMLLSYTEFTLRALRYMDIPYLSYHFIGTFVVSYALSFLACLLVEAPCMGLERAVLKKLGVKK